MDDASGVTKKKKRKQDEGGNAEELDPSNPLGDQRFAAMFKNQDFEVDQESEAFQRLHPILAHRDKKRDKKRTGQMSSATETQEDVEEEVGLRASLSVFFFVSSWFVLLCFSFINTELFIYLLVLYLPAAATLFDLSVCLSIYLSNLYLSS